MIVCSICSNPDFCDGPDICNCHCHEGYGDELGAVEDDLDDDEEDDEEIDDEED
jgi:hypothetical protein